MEAEQNRREKDIRGQWEEWKRAREQRNDVGDQVTRGRRVSTKNNVKTRRME